MITMTASGRVASVREIRNTTKGDTLGFTIFSRPVAQDHDIPVLCTITGKKAAALSRLINTDCYITVTGGASPQIHPDGNLYLNMSVIKADLQGYALDEETQPMTETTDLIPAGRDLKVLYGTDKEPSKIEATLEAITERVRSEVADVSTAKGRDAIRTLAADVGRSKKRLEEAGLELTKDWREKTAAVNGQKKKIIDTLDALRIEAREPLTEWEEVEEKRKAMITDTLTGLAVDAAGTHMDPDFIRDLLTYAEGLDLADEKWGDAQPDIEHARNRAIEAWTQTLAGAEKRIADEAELERLRKAERERIAKDAKDAAQKAAEEAKVREEAEAAERAEKAAQARLEAIRARLATEFTLPNDTSAALPSDHLQSLLDQKRSIPVDDQTWGNQMELAEAKKVAVVATLEAMLSVALSREDAAEEQRNKEAREREEREAAEERAAFEAQKKAEEEEARQAEAAASEHKGQIIAGIAAGLQAFGDISNTEMAEKIYAGELPHVTVTID